MDSEISENIKVYVRERPYLETETTEIDKISSVTGSKDGSVSYSSNNNFKFDSIVGRVVHSTGSLNQVYNVAVGERTTLNNLFFLLRTSLSNQPSISRKLRQAIKDTQPIYCDFRSGDIRHSQACIEKARHLLGYEPTHLLTESIEEVVHWFCSNQIA
jgi:UDP-N-acetylglucosamine 4-epimerase